MQLLVHVLCVQVHSDIVVQGTVVTHLFGSLICDGLEDVLQGESRPKHVEEVLVRAERVDARVEAPDVEEAGGSDDTLVRDQHGSHAEVETGVVGAYHALGIAWIENGD